jgi:hypothetical protein
VEPCSAFSHGLQALVRGQSVSEVVRVQKERRLTLCRRSRDVAVLAQQAGRGSARIGDPSRYAVAAPFNFSSSVTPAGFCCFNNNRHHVHVVSVPRACAVLVLLLDLHPLLFLGALHVQARWLQLQGH